MGQSSESIDQACISAFCICRRARSWVSGCYIPCHRPESVRIPAAVVRKWHTAISNGISSRYGPRIRALCPVRFAGEVWLQGKAHVLRTGDLCNDPIPIRWYSRRTRIRPRTRRRPDLDGSWVIDRPGSLRSFLSPVRRLLSEFGGLYPFRYRAMHFTHRSIGYPPPEIERIAAIISRAPGTSRWKNCGIEPPSPLDRLAAPSGRGPSVERPATSGRIASRGRIHSHRGRGTFAPPPSISEDWVVG